MDVSNLISDAKSRFSTNSSKAYLADKYKAKLIVAAQGGLWNVTPTLLAFLRSSKNQYEIIIDEFNNPVRVLTKGLLTSLEETYKTVMKEWYDEVKALEQ